MKKYFPIILACFSCVFFLALIIRNELHLKNSDSIFIQLQPVDPRSLIQGDYMVLNYHLFWHDVSLNQIQNQATVIAYIQVDHDKRVTATTLTAKYPQKIQLKNLSNQIDQLYPASNSFLFAEGLAECYQRAEYAEFKINPQGKSILASLRDANLAALNCEDKKSWWQGFNLSNE